MKALTRIQSGVVLVAIFLVLAISSCNNPATQDKQANAAAADTIKKEVTLSPESQSLLNSFPTPFEVTTMLEKAKAGFIFDITNPPANVGKYTTEISKSLSLGFTVPTLVIPLPITVRMKQINSWHVPTN